MKYLIVCLLLASSCSCVAQTYSYSALYSFGTSAKDGVSPVGGLIMDGSGNLYGTTSEGGGSSACSGGCGTVFKFTSTKKESILHAFTGTDGSNPVAGLAMDSAKNLYGMTQYGGATGSGVLFKITAAGKFSILHQFGRVANDGLYPVGPPTLDSAGTIYGATEYGGTNQTGTIFKLSSKGKETIIYNFGLQPDGANPAGNLILDSSGNIFGTTRIGGLENGGTFFEISSSGAETVLYSFCSQIDCVDGGVPSYIVEDSSGNFYGEALDSGIVYELSSNGVETPLYSFCLSGGIECADGGASYGPLLILNGVIYGTGNHNGTNQVAYSLTTTGDENDLHDFVTFNEGTQPLGGMASGSKGNLFGTTYTGGKHGNGVIFELIKQ